MIVSEIYRFSRSIDPASIFPLIRASRHARNLGVTKTIEIAPDINPRYDCSVFQYEPVIQPGSHEYLHHMTLYECRGDQGELESAAKTDGSVCYVPDKPAFQCNTIAATWSLGSEVRRKLHSHTRTYTRRASNSECLRISEFNGITKESDIPNLYAAAGLKSLFISLSRDLYLFVI